MHSGINPDKNGVRLSDPAPLYENYTNLDFDAKHLKRGWKGGGGGEFCGALFGKYRILP